MFSCIFELLSVRQDTDFRNTYSIWVVLEDPDQEALRPHITQNHWASAQFPLVDNELTPYKTENRIPIPSSHSLVLYKDRKTSIVHTVSIYSTGKSCRERLGLIRE